MRYQYCPCCGSKLVPRKAGDDGEVPFCVSCRKLWFDTFASCVIVLLANEQGEIAMLRQRYLSDRYWSYVAGFIKPGESAEETAAREVEEELGIRIERLEYAGTYWFGPREQLMHGFVAFARKQDLKLSTEVNAAEWVPAEKAPELMFPEAPGNAQQPLYRKYLRLVDSATNQ